MDAYAVRCQDIARRESRAAGGAAHVPPARWASRAAAGRGTHLHWRTAHPEGMPTPWSCRKTASSPSTPGAPGGCHRDQCAPGARAHVRRGRRQWIAAAAGRGERRQVLARARPPQALRMASLVGRTSLTVSRRPRVALFSTGDELVMPGAVPEQMRPGAIYNSNRFLLRVARRLGAKSPTTAGSAPRRPRGHRGRPALRAQGNDLILTSGGVSVGEEDHHLRPAVQPKGSLDCGRWPSNRASRSPMAWWGQPAWFMGPARQPGVELHHLPAAGARPSCCACRAPDQLPALAMRADFDVGQSRQTPEFLRVRLNEQGGLDLFANQSSGVLTSAVWGDGVVDVPFRAAHRQETRCSRLCLVVGVSCGMNVQIKYFASIREAVSQARRLWQPGRARSVHCVMR